MKRKIALLLVAIICCMLCLTACRNDMVGTYKTSFTDGIGRQKIYLILKKNNKFEAYKLGEGETDDFLEEGVTLFPGTYSVKDDTITLKFKYDSPVTGKEETDEIKGSITSDGKIRIVLFARTNLLSKQD